MSTMNWKVCDNNAGDHIFLVVGDSVVLLLVQHNLDKLVIVGIIAIMSEFWLESSGNSGSEQGDLHAL